MTNRQMDILCYLREQKDYVTALEISNVIQMSVQTIRNELNIIQDSMNQAGLGMIYKKPRRGIKLEIDEDAWKQLLCQSDEIQQSGHIPDIKYQIIYLLMVRGSLSLTYIQNQLYAGRSSVERLVPDIMKWFQSHGMNLEKRKGRGYEIRYEEFQWRLAMWDIFFIMKRKDRSHLFSKERLEYQPNEYSLIEDFLKGFDTAGVNRAIYALEESCGFSYGYEAHIQMFFLLSLCIIRSRQKHTVRLPTLSPCKISGSYPQFIRGNLIEALESYYHMKLESDEQDFAEFVIEISDIQNFRSTEKMLVCQARNQEVCYFTYRMVSLMSDIVNVNLRKDLFFLESLFLQLQSMIPRLRYHIRTENPLLRQVKQRYPNIFAAISAVGVYFQKELGLDLNEHEMCTLALLLGGAIERSMSTVTACIICDYGVGISQLLKEQMERAVSDIKIAEVLSVRDLKKLVHIPCDLVVTTIQLKNPCYGKEVVTVGHLMTPLDIKNIENAMKQVRRRNLKKRQPCKKLHICKNLFYDEFVFLQVNAADKQSILRLLCKKLSEAGYVTEDFLQSVMDHETTAPTALGKGLALPHGFASYVIRPAVAVATLTAPVLWQEKEKADVVFLLAFNLDEAAGMKEETIKFYSVFLDLFDDPEKVNEIRRSDSPVLLAEQLNQKVRDAVVLEE
ncbi:PTS sugar transporter subunit IIA [Lachnospiraceae bacterium 54-53]